MSNPSFWLLIKCVGCIERNEVTTMIERTSFESNIHTIGAVMPKSSENISKQVLCRTNYTNIVRAT